MGREPGQSVTGRRKGIFGEGPVRKYEELNVNL